jgi:hypothetical protein
MLRHSHVPCPPESNETEVSTRYPPCTLLRGLLAGLPKLGSAAAMTTDSKPSKQGSAQPPRKHQPMFGASSSRYRDGWSEDRRLSCLQNGHKVSDVRLLRSEGENSIPRLYPSPRTPVAPSNGLTDAKKADTNSCIATRHTNTACSPNTSCLALAEMYHGLQLASEFDAQSALRSHSRVSTAIIANGVCF